MGNLIQGTGINVGGESTKALLDRMAKESNLKKVDGSPVKEWADLEPYQRKVLEANPQFASELAMRNATAVTRGDERAKAAQQLKDVDKKRYVQEDALGKEFDAKLISPKDFIDRYGDIQGEAAAEKARLDTVFQIFKVTQELPEDPNERARVQYYQAWDNARLESGLIDFDKVDTLLATLEKAWTPEQKAYVERNIKLADHPERVKEYLRDKETLKPYWEVATTVQAISPDYKRIHEIMAEVAHGKPVTWMGDIYATTQDVEASWAWKLYQKDVTDARKRLRGSDPKIEEAGRKWYGWQPIEDRGRSGRVGR